ncbi:MAG TPA: hypothetical protein VHK67_06000 [Rhabdochlamydiaceae bacterium]|jgi:hypothetical protein|nr:hypothetical protein [Rhabdochlamydiaceae bacterium]
MDAISAAETFTDSAELFNQDKYKSTVEISLEPDPIQMEKDFQKPLSQRIIPIHTQTKSIYGDYRVDDVLVRCPSEAYRAHQQRQWDSAKNEWNGVKKEAEARSWSWTVTTICTSIVAIVGGVLANMDKGTAVGYLGEAVANSPFAPILLIAGLVATFTSIVFVAKALSAINEANEQINKANEQISKWGDNPVMKIGLARDYAHNQGFPYIYRNDLKLGQGPSKTALLHPIQVEYEFKKYFNNFCNQLLGQLNPSPTTWIDQFRHYNPVSASLMNYGLGHIPVYMKPVTEDFGRLQSMLNDIANAYDRLKSGVTTTARDQVAAYTTTKNELLQPLAKLRDHGILAAEKERDLAFKDPDSTPKQRQDARKLFDAVKGECEATYAKNAAPINAKYNKKIKHVEEERDATLKRLDEQKSSQLSNNYHAARELLARAKEAWDNKHYRPINFQQYFPTQQTGQPAWMKQQPGYYHQPITYPQPPAYPRQPIVYSPAAYPQPVHYPHSAPPVVHQSAPPPVPPSKPHGYHVHDYPIHAPIPAANRFTYNRGNGG